MNFWLILKQSVRSFYSKIALYLTFTIFLIIAFGMIVGLFGFSYGFEKNLEDSLGHVRLNQQNSFAWSYAPTWVVEDRGNTAAVAELDPGKRFNNAEINHQITTFLINEFPDAFPIENGPYATENLVHPQNTSQLQLALATLGIGYNYGNLMSNLYEDEIYNNQLLYHYFSTLAVGTKHTLADNIQTNLALFNQFVNAHYPQFNTKYFTSYLAAALLLDQIKTKSNDYLLAYGNDFNYDFISPVYENPSVIIKYQGLNTQSNLVKYRPDLIQTTPWLLFSNEANPFNITSELKASELAAYKNFIDDYRYTYVPPKFLKKYHLSLGDKLTLRYKRGNQLNEPIDFLIIGTAAEQRQFNSGPDPNFTIPYQWALRYQLPNSNNLSLAQKFTPYRAKIRARNLKFGDDVIAAQKEAAKENLKYFNSLRPEDEARFYRNLIDTGWFTNSLQVSYDMVIDLFYVLSTVLSLLIMILLFVVFYFITREIINMERSTLSYLKAMGIYNRDLSLLITLAMMVPIVIGIIGGIFVALAIQKMVFDIALSRTVLDLNYFTFNSVFVLTLILSILVIFLGFYLINLYFLHSPALLSQSVRNPKLLARLLIKTKSKVDTHLSREVRITLAFSFKNIYKNIVTFFILAITFGLILYIVQFQSSLTAIANAYEKWNQPYKSVLYQPLLAPTISDGDDYQRSYEVINEEGMNSLTAIDISPGADKYLQLKMIINNYVASINDPATTFNWANYYFTKNFSKTILTEIGPDPTDEQINDLIDQIVAGTGAEVDYQFRGQVIAMVKQIVEQNTNLKTEFGYDDGYNIFLGKVLVPQSQSNRNVLTLDTTYWEKGNHQVKTILFENDALSRNHYDFVNATSAANYIQPGTFLVTKDKDQAVQVKDPLRVNISSYLQTNYNVHVGDVVPLRLSGFKTDATFDGYQGDNSALVYAYVANVVRGDTIENTFFTSQIGVLNYLAQGNHEQPIEPSTITDQRQFYQNLLAELENHQTTLSNTVFSADMDVPFGIRNITLPFYTRTEATKAIGSRIEDFYSAKGDLQEYLESFGDNLVVFHLITAALNSRTEQFISILWRFVIILTLFALIVSLLLVTLVLLENRKIISVLKALGYRRTEITRYLISGYLLSTILAVIASIGVSFLAFFLTKRPISKYLGMSVYYLFSWQFFLLAISLGIIFAGIMAISIAVFTRYQNPKNAFVGT